MLRLPVVYIRGLNTYDDDAIHVGPWSWKTMDYYWLESLKRKGVHGIGLRGWSGVTLDQHLINAEKEFLRATQSIDQVHLVGHSMGGLVSRHLAKKFPNRVASVSTLSTPHRGSQIAQKILEAKELRYKLIKRGYDRHPLAQSLWDLAPGIVADKFPDSDELSQPCFGYIFDLPVREMTRFCQVVHHTLGLKKGGDGFVDLDSQTWGQTKGPYALDHMDQVGVFLHLNPKKRRLKQERFQKLVDDLIENLQMVEKKPI